MVPLIEVRNLFKQFNNITAVDDLSFSVNEGDIYGFLGQNGAGKSTTIRMLLTLIKPGKGEIKIFGKDINLHRHEILSQTGSMIERPDMYKYLSAYDNLSIFARMSSIKADRKMIMDKLDMVGLAERCNIKVKTFSQGMKQRLGIAIALVHDPKLIILDEPTNGLDPQGIADIRRLIIDLSKQLNKTVVVSSHLLSEIELVANRMLIINKGKKIAEGVVSELLDPSKTLVYIETTNNIAAISVLQETGLPVKSGKDNLQVSINKKDIPALVSKLTDKGIGIISINPRHSLEDYFLSLTNTAAHA